MRDIHCSQCGKFLFSTDKSDGAAAAEASSHGVIVKVPMMYGILGFCFFCCEDCCKRWFSEHVSEEQRKSGKENLQKFKDSMEAGKPALLAGLQRIQKAGEMFKKLNPHIRSEMANGGRYYMPVVDGKDISETWFFTKDAASRALREYLKRMIQNH